MTHSGIGQRRRKKLSTTGGENRYPAEVKTVVISQAAVNELAVIDQPGDNRGEIACAIVMGDGSNPARKTTSVSALQHCRVTSCPNRLSIQVIPRKPAGKVPKRMPGE